MGSFKLGKMTMRSLFGKPETLRYPFETKEPPAGLKGHIRNDLDVCIFCGMCARVCPAAALEVDKAAKSWTIDRFRCVQCGSCTRSCPKSCLSMEPSYAPAATKRASEVFVKTVVDSDDDAASEEQRQAVRQAKIEAALKAKAQREAEAV